MPEKTHLGSRRRFLGHAIAASATVVLAPRVSAQPRAPDASSPRSAGAGRSAGATGMPDAGAAPQAQAVSHPSLVQPPLPYPENALGPHISAQTLAFHYGKHHKGYFEKTNQLLEGTPFKGKPLEEIVKRTAKSKPHQKLFNNAAQAWNHNFYWQSMKPRGGGAPAGELRLRVEKDFGTYEDFRAKFTQAAVDHFSNGWVWLVLDKGGKLKIVDTHDADTPLAGGLKPLAVSDVWEHAYYLDYKNARKDYVTAFLDHLLNWDFVAQNLG